MKDNGYICLDTRAIDNVIKMREALIAAYDRLNDYYDRSVNRLLQNWVGHGADAFKKDAETVRTNIVGIFDILKTMCDTLEDCREIFGKCDATLGVSNRQG